MTEINNMKELSVIVVDDDSQLRSMYSRLLRDERYRLCVVETPENVLSLMAASPVAVLLTDYQMPLMNGNDLCRIVMDNYPLTTRIMVSGTKQPEGFNGHYFLAKPFTNGEVKEAVIKGIEDYLTRLQEKTNP